MPPRKSNVSVTSNGPEDGAEGTPVKSAKDGLSVEDLSLPKSMIARLAKGVLPANTQIQKDALLALHKSATVFVSYIASSSNENASMSGKKTISPQDVMAAMKDCEFEEFLPRLEAELKKYNETQCDKRNTYRRKVKEEKAAAAAREADDVPKEGETTEGANGALNGHFEIPVEDAERPFKKFKAEDGSSIAPDPDGTEDEMDADQDAEPDADDQHDDDEVEEDDDDENDDDEGEDDDEDGDGQATKAEPLPPGYATTSAIRDEALDDQDSDSD